MADRVLRWHDPARVPGRVVPHDREPTRAVFDLTRHPTMVAGAWAKAMAEGDVESAVGLYAHDARLHTPAGTVRGRRQLRGYLRASPLLGVGRLPVLDGVLDGARLVWGTVGGEWTDVLLRVADGEIAEQWIEGPDTAELEDERSGPLPPIDVVVRGDVPHDTVAYAHGNVARSMETLAEPVLHARLKLSMLPGRAVERPALAEALLDVNGDIVRAQVAARTATEAADLLEDRLRDRLEHRRRRRLGMEQLEPEPGAWRHGVMRALRPAYLDRPVEERELVRRKAYTLRAWTPAEAAADMEGRDYDFHLFRDLDSGEDAVVWRSDDSMYGLTRLRTAGHTRAPSTAPMAPGDVDAPERAIERLDAGGEPFVFFRDAATGRGHVVYRRYDGHYGLIAPAGSPS